MNESDQVKVKIKLKTGEIVELPFDQVTDKQWADTGCKKLPNGRVVPLDLPSPPAAG